MDPLTQGLLGAAVAHVGFRRRLGPKATWIGLVAGMAPDLDVIVSGLGFITGDSFLGLKYHRQFSHSLAFAPVGALLVAAVFSRGRDERGKWPWVFACALAAWLTHGVLDCCTTYGTELLWPFSDVRIAWSNVSIVDPAYTLILAAGLFVSGRLHRAGNPDRAWSVALLALALSTGYLGFGASQRERVREAAMHSLAAAGHDVDRLMVAPTPLNLVLWRVVAQRTDGSFVVGAARATIDTQVVLGDPAPSTPPALGPELVQRTRELRIFTHFTDGWMRWRPHPDEDGAFRVVDMRYGTYPSDVDGLWGADIFLEGSGGDMIVERYRRTPDVRMRDFLKGIFGTLDER